MQILIFGNYLEIIRLQSLKQDITVDRLYIVGDFNFIHIDWVTVTDTQLTQDSKSDSCLT